MPISSLFRPWSTKVCVYRSAGPADGHMVRHLLASEGIPVEMRGESLQGLQGAIPVGDAFPSLWVLRHNARRAQDLITRFEQGPSRHHPAWDCRCGEANEPVFGSCWRCGRDRPDLLAALAE